MGCLAGCCSLGCLTQAVSFGGLLCFVKPRLRLEQWSQANALPLSPAGPHLGPSMWLNQPSLPPVLAALPLTGAIHAVGSSVNIGQ